MIEVVGAAEAGFPRVARVFGGPGDPGRCWCQWFRLPNREFEASSPEALRDRLEAEVDGPEPGPGVVAVEAGEPVGWAAVAPVAGYRRLTAGRSPLRPHLGGESAWAVTCFVVPREHRGRGVAHALLDGAVAHARDRGAVTVEAYPVDTAARSRVPAADLYHGPLSLFLAHGFTEVVRPSAARAVVRRRL